MIQHYYHFVQSVQTYSIDFLINGYKLHSLYSTPIISHTEELNLSLIIGRGEHSHS